jgi:hypothetical protein
MEQNYFDYLLTREPREVPPSDFNDFSSIDST